MLSAEEQKTLKKALNSLSIGFSSTQEEQIQSYLFELLKWNKVYNLTGFKTFQENLVGNILDCLAVVPYIQATRVIDVGSGAGLPGLMLSICNTEQQVTLLDANGKKTRFMQQAIQILGLDNVEVINQRSESLQTEQPYEAMCSRAFKKIPESLLMVEHLLADEAQFFAMKGKLLEEDLNSLPKWARIADIKTIQVPMLAGERHLVCIEINKKAG